MPTKKIASAGRKPQGAKKASSGDGAGNQGRLSSKRQQPKDEGMLASQEILRLVDAAAEGRLSERGKASEFDGVYREMIEGVNQIIDSVTAPLKVASTYIERISRGDIPAKITDTYNGDFNALTEPRII